MKQICLAFATALLALSISSPANAQYVWLDKNNVKVYSDKPPPPDVPNNRILKGPRTFRATNISEKQPDANGTTDTKAASTPEKPPMTTAEKNADYNKRKMEQAEKDKKTEAEEKNKRAKAENCAKAKEYQRSLESGGRFARTTESGERKYLSDDERAAEINRANEAVKACN
jgi:hypothetical protein